MIGRKHLPLGLVALLAASLWATSICAESHSFMGKGQQASPLFTLDEGLAVFTLKHDGKRYFGVWLMDQDGNKLELLANTTGPFDGSKAVRINRPGSYLLDVSADGQWSISRSKIYHNPFVRQPGEQTPVFSTRSAHSGADIPRRSNGN